MACSYCDSTADHCKCRNDHWDYPHRSRGRTYDHSRSLRDESPLRYSSCSGHNDRYSSRSKSRHRRHSHDHYEARPKSRHRRHSLDHYESRSKSRPRRYSSHHISICEYCNENLCQCDRISRSRNAVHPHDCSRHGYGPCEFHISRTRSEHDGHKPSQDAEQTLRIQLFEAKKKEKKYEEATEIYRDAMSFDKTRGSSDKMLKLKASFADMQVNEGNCNEAERVLDDILRWKDLPSGLKAQCYGIHGKLLCAWKRYAEAENLYRKLYDRASKDEASLAMGDEMCNAIALQGDLDRAQLEQRTLLEKRKQILGTGHTTTVKSANKTVGNIRKMIQKLPKANGIDLDQRTLKRKQVLEADIEYLLRDIWEPLKGGTQNQEPEALKLGYELGLSMSNQGKFDQAERVLNEVHKGRAQKLGDNNKDTMWAGILLGQAMYRQAFAEPSYPQEMSVMMYHQQLCGRGYSQGSSTQTYPVDCLSKCQFALSILLPIWTTARRQAYTDDHSIVKAAGAHLSIVYAKLGDYVSAGQHLLSVMYLPAAEGVAPMPPLRLMNSVYKQAQKALNQQNMTWDSISKPKKQTGHGGVQRQLMGPGTLMPVRLLPGISTSQAIPNRLAIASEPFNSPSAFGYATGQTTNSHENLLNFGKSYMQLRDYKTAARILGQAWNQPTAIVQEKGTRAICGDRYGVCLDKLGHISKAVKVLKDVKAFKRQNGQPDREIRKTGELIRRAKGSL